MAFARGIDISAHQPNIDWARAIQATGISFVLVKASDGKWTDTAFAGHWPEARQAGLLRGAYHFLRVTPDPHQQINVFLSALGDDPGELPPILDIEDPDVHALANQGLTAHAAAAAQLTAAAKIWLSAVESQLKCRPIIYTAGWWWNANMFLSGSQPTWAAGYRLWVANYPFIHSVPDVAQIEQGSLTPLMPNGWTNWQFWQYSGDLATVDGITDALGRQPHVDLDVFNGTLDDLHAAASAAVSTPAADGSADTQPHTSPAAGLTLPDPRVTNQILINAFSHAFGTINYWQVVQRAGLADIANARQAEYSGPAIAALTNLTDAEQAALQQQLSHLVGAS
jgi:GH25 family lysozyme M1 (1,4-beta-N-acetylmuramidase)